MVVLALELFAVQGVNGRFVFRFINERKFHFRLGGYICPDGADTKKGKNNEKICKKEPLQSKEGKKKKGAKK